MSMACCHVKSYFKGLKPRTVANALLNTMRSVHMDVHPAKALIDDTIKIQIKGLSAQQPITVSAFLQEAGSSFVSHAHYVSDSHGHVDLGTFKSHGGTYTGQEPMGLFWSMQPAPFESEGLRLVKKDVTTPYQILLSVINNHINPASNLESEDVLATTMVERWYMDDHVQRIPVHEGRIRGTLFIPKNEGPSPCVIDLFGTSGGLAEFRASLLASRGFTSLALAYCFYEDLPKSYEVDLEYFEEAIEWLQKHPAVAPGGIGIIGMSKGGEIATHTAVISEAIKACVSISASSYNTTGSHTYKGQLIPAVSLNPERMSLKNGALVIKDTYDTPTEESYFPVERAKSAHFLFIHGGEDEMVSPSVANDLPNRLAAHGKSNYTLLFYEGAGHLIEPPHAPLCSVFNHRVFNQLMAAGGKTKAHAHAQADCWAQILQFLKTHLPRPGNSAAASRL